MLPPEMDPIQKKNMGLYHRYDVARVDGKPVSWCFVLEDTDPLAIDAIRAYASACYRKGYGVLARELEAKAEEMRKRIPLELR